MRSQTGSPALRSSRISPLTGRTGGRASAGSQAASPDQAPAASTTRPPAAPRRPRAARPPGSPPSGPPTTSAPPRTSAPAPAQRRQQRGAQRPRDRPPPRRARARRRAATGLSPGSSSRQRRGAQPLRLEAERALQVVAPAQLRGLVAVERDVQRPRRAGSPSPIPEAALELGRRRPDTGSAAAIVISSRRSSPKVASPDRRQHPRGDRGRARAAGLAALEHRDRAPRARQPPGAGEADHAAADDRSRRSSSSSGSISGRTCSLPCAGITRIRFRRSAAPQPPSQPVVGSRSADRTPSPAEPAPRRSRGAGRDDPPMQRARTVAA